MPMPLNIQVAGLGDYRSPFSVYIFLTQNFALTTRRQTQQAIEIPALDRRFLCCEVGGPG